MHGPLRTEQIPAADRIEFHGGSLLVHTNNSDAVARYLLGCPAIRDVRIDARSLQDAFLTLTKSAPIGATR